MIVTRRIIVVGSVLWLVGFLFSQQQTWEPPSANAPGKLTAARLHALPDSAFAFPRLRKEPLTDAAHVRSAIARFAQVKNASDEEREVAFANIKKAADYFGVHLRVTDWHKMGLPNPQRAMR
jgi:hypothetical protein